MKTITTKFLAPTNTKGARIKVSSGKVSRVYGWDDEFDIEPNHKKAINKFCLERDNELIKDHPDHATMWSKDKAFGWLPNDNMVAVFI